MSNETRSGSALKVTSGVVQLVIALAIYLWASNHSPHMGFFEALSKLDSYVIKEPVYSVILLTAAIIALLGVIQIIRGLQSTIP
jgi:hypothetical protein